MIDILLLAGAASDGPSMGRYARELSGALRRLPEQGRAITLDAPTAASSSRVGRAWQRYLTYPHSVRRHRADVFHILDQGYAHLIRGLDPARTVVTCHDLIPLLAAEQVLPMKVSRILARTFRWRVAHLRRARAVIAVSHATKATLERYAGVASERIRVIPQGVATTFAPHREAAQATRATAGLAETTTVLLQVASGSRYKNTPAALHALARLRERRGDGVVLVRVGSAMCPDEAGLARNLGVLGAVREIGRVDDDTLVAWYNAADVLIFPSLGEGFGWPPLEAMACGTPVVASDTPAVEETVGDAALLVSPTDHAALADAVDRVLTDTALARSLREKGIVRARSFTWDRTAAATMAVYEEIASGEMANPS